jgi:hypothetical protein
MKTIREIPKEGIRTLTKTPGPVDMARCIQRYETRSGDYTKERHEGLPDNPGDVKERLHKRQKKMMKRYICPFSRIPLRHLPLLTNSNDREPLDICEGNELGRPAFYPLPH